MKLEIGMYIRYINEDNVTYIDKITKSNKNEFISSNTKTHIVVASFNTMDVVEINDYIIDHNNAEMRKDGKYYGNAYVTLIKRRY